MDNQPVIVLIILIVAVIFANMIVIQSVKKREADRRVDEYVQKGAKPLPVLFSLQKSNNLC
jgi:hypothetical protein